jgi:tripartite-type tricarboxylate transporter receptor subunit TctC
MKPLQLAFALVAFTCTAPVMAQTFPAKPVTLVVPFAAGGPTDTLARTLAGPMGVALGQPIVVENVTGAGGSIGVGHVIHAAPDGYTVSIGNWSTNVLNGEIYDLPYDLIKDLEPVALLPSAPQLIVAKKSMPPKNLGELIRWLKERQAAVGTAGVGSAGHVSGLLFQKITGASFSFVHYRGAGPAMLDLLGERLDVMFDQASNSLPNVKAGTIKAYAVTRKTRLASAPDIPTVDEAGLPGFYISVWSGLWVPKGTPAGVVAKLNAAAVKALADPQLQKTFAALGQDLPRPDQHTPAALAKLQKAEIDKWWPLLKAANVKAH